MRKYESMLNDTDNKINTLRAAIEQQAPAVSMTGAAESTSDIALARQAQERGEGGASRNAMKIIGKEWAMAEAVRPQGDRVNSIGVANFTREGKELMGAGLLAVNLEATGKIIRSEKRTVIPTNVQDLRLKVGSDGALLMERKGSGKPGLPVSAGVVEAVCDYFPATFSKVKQGLIWSADQGGMDPEHKVEVFNRMVVDRIPKELTGRRTGELAVVGRIQHNAWQLWTVRGAKNTANEVDGAAFCDLIRDALHDSGLYGGVEYNPETGRVSFESWLMPNHIVDLSAGDVFKAGISGSTNDAKAGKYRISFSVIRNLCHNLIILSHEGAEVFSATHNSAPARVVLGIRDGLLKSDAAVNEFRNLWGMLRAAPVEDVDTVLDEMAPEIRQPGLTAADIRAMLGRAYDAEPGGTWADISNAISRLHLEREIDAFTLAQDTGRLLPILAQRAAAEA